MDEEEFCEYCGREDACENCNDIHDEELDAWFNGDYEMFDMD